MERVVIGAQPPRFVTGKMTIATGVPMKKTEAPRCVPKGLFVSQVSAIRTIPTARSPHVANPPHAFHPAKSAVVFVPISSSIPNTAGIVDGVACLEKSATKGFVFSIVPMERPHPAPDLASICKTTTTIVAHAETFVPKATAAKKGVAKSAVHPIRRLCAAKAVTTFQTTPNIADFAGVSVPTAIVVQGATA